MSRPWPLVKLGEVLRKQEDVALIEPEQGYREITVRLWGKGVTLRGMVAGSELVGSRRFIAHSGDLILSKIDARNGAIGLVPEELDGGVVTQDFPLFTHNRSRLEPGYLAWMTKTVDFVQLCLKASEGTTNRVRLKQDRFLGMEIPLPPLEEQRRIVSRIEEVATRVEAVRKLQAEQAIDIRHTLAGMFSRLIEGAPLRPMSEVAPQVRRGVDIDPDGSYPELGIRSFGKGTFHKPALTALEIGDKRVFRIEPGDLVFSNVFAWEGAIAVVQPEDSGRVGSHRYITCIVKPEVALAEFLCFYFLTPDGLDKIRAASPGGAGRNRTLGLSALDRIEVPVPSLESQREFCKLMRLEKGLRAARATNDLELGSMVPSVLSRAFRGKA